MEIKQLTKQLREIPALGYQYGAAMNLNRAWGRGRLGQGFITVIRSNASARANRAKDKPRLLDVRFRANNGLKSAVAPCPQSAKGRNRSRGRTRRLATQSIRWRGATACPRMSGAATFTQDRRIPTRRCSTMPSVPPRIPHDLRCGDYLDRQIEQFQFA